MAKKRKFAPGAWKEEAFRESTTDSSDTNETQGTDDSGVRDNNTMVVDQDTSTAETTAIAAVVAESILEEDDNVESLEKRQKIEEGNDGGE